jgi:hypothetical protein
MAAFNKFNVLNLDLFNGVHQLAAHTIKSMLTASVPILTNATKADIPELAAGNGYTAGGTALTITTSQLAGVAKAVVAADITWTATGPLGPFRCPVQYNDTPVSPLKPLISWYDVVTPISLAAGETFTVDFDQVGGFITLT